MNNQLFRDKTQRMHANTQEFIGTLYSEQVTVPQVSRSDSKPLKGIYD